jgi:acetyl esterase/lipase
MIKPPVLSPLLTTALGALPPLTGWVSRGRIYPFPAIRGGQYGELDKRITDGWPAFDSALTEAGVPHEGHIYKGANHGFHNDTTPRYDEAAAKEAWQHTLDWFNKYLR